MNLDCFHTYLNRNYVGGKCIKSPNETWVSWGNKYFICLGVSTRAHSVPFLIPSWIFSCENSWSPDNKEDAPDAEFLLWNVSHFSSWLPERQKSSGQISLILCVFIKCCHSLRQPGPLMIYFYILLSTATLFAPVSKCLVKVPWGAITEQHK